MIRIMFIAAVLIVIGGGVFLVSCGETARFAEEAGYGRSPALPEPRETLLPTVNIAPARGWPDGGLPVPADGLAVAPFASDLDHPRWIHVLPNGDVLIAESNAPANPPIGGIVGFIERRVMERAGARTPSADRITLLRDSDGDGVVETRTVFLENLHSPFGMALVDGTLYVANTNAVVAFPYEDGQTRIEAEGTTLTELPAGPINRHWTKNLIASEDGEHLYVAIGSNSNIAENGLEAEEGRAAIWEIDRATGEHRIFASGLRNPVGMDWEPESGILWTAVNERDELGSDLVPDYMTSVEAGDFYGWPWSYFGTRVDTRVEPARPDMVERAMVPDYALGAHTASLGLVFADQSGLGPRWQSGVFIGQHGSWNRVPHSGYKVIYIPFAGGEPTGGPIDVLTGFLDEDGNALGRPVGVEFDRTGALLVADDVGNIIWRVTRSE
ncbi:PQQ-dependent sugar dehydrogenase [Hyphobacterium marinum]|uniref:Sorbosone dehydrogenase family protein n=1 Tax=Hyphobacterium marinum TaxID=3116574 RepID=A0ABU7LXL9_9PROT|nr:sorbosone dehydrogenase family protein [Hyphobacterium sp. Y6023]MEE2566283.1 sorbosone dehydrogenase family protein [Hyphobacterium sp. Y6023]